MHINNKINVFVKAMCRVAAKKLLNNKEIGMMLPKKRANTSGVGESNNYYEDIYNKPPYNNTH